MKGVHNRASAATTMANARQEQEATGFSIAGNNSPDKLYSASVPLKSMEEGEYEGDQKLLSGLYERVRGVRIHLENYCGLFAFVIFASIYSAILYLQADSFKSFKVGNAHNPLLPPDYSPAGPYSFSSVDDIYSWINGSILQTVWTSTACGNGICDRPQEYPAFGPDNRFGCASDCGTFPNTSSVTFTVATSFTTAAEQAAASWNLCLTSPVELCWYENSQTFTGDLSSYNTYVFNLPDGDWTFKLTAPTGGVVVFANPTNENNPELYLFSLGLGCSATNGTAKSAYTTCRDACANVTANCYAKTCPGASSSSILESFLTCLRPCSSSSTVADQTGNLTSMTCPQQLNYLLGSTECENSTVLDPILTLPSDAETVTLPTTVPRTAYRAALWNQLGPSDSDRLFNLAAAVQRAMYTWIKDACLVSTPKSLDLGPRLTPFFCTFFGGPTNLTGCSYVSALTEEVLITDEELFSEMEAIHSRLNLSKEQQDKFTEIMVLALRSVYALDERTVVAFNDRLRELDRFLIKTEVNHCNTVDYTVPMSSTATTSALYRYVNVGDSVQWIWEDDNEHSLTYGLADDSVGAGTSVYPQGFGAGQSYLSRNTICTPENIGLGGFDSDPVPCNLVDPSSSSRYFTYTLLFNGEGFIENATNVWAFGSGRAGDNAEGGVYIYEADSIAATNASGAYFCNSNCPLALISNGRCDAACNNAGCAFDGGDCSCPVDVYGRQVCSCPPGQIRGYGGECCDDSGTGTNVEGKFQRRVFGNDTEASNKDFVPTEDVALVRTTAKLNRVLVGMMVSQNREVLQTCDEDDTKFTFLQDRCLGKESSTPFGISPQALLQSSLYSSDFLSAASDIYTQNKSFSNSSLAFNAEGIPYGFYVANANGSSYGFTYIFDINLSSDDANKLLTYLVDGYFIDNATKHINVKLVTYNGQARVFTLISVDITFEIGGRLAVKADVKSLSTEHYTTATDWVRFTLEILFLIGLLYNILGEVHEYFLTVRKTGSFLGYFGSFWNTVDVISLSIMVAGTILWGLNIARLENDFTIQAKYKIYETPLTPYTYWKISSATEFSSAIHAFHQLSDMSFFRSYYFALHGINIFLVVLRILKLMDFQPRLGTITRTIAAAAPDLFHFFIIYALVFVGFALYAHVAFGSQVDQFRTMGASLNSCFKIILGNDGATDHLFQLEGWELVAGVIFWWSYVLVVCFVVFNILIAIIVDSYATVKGEIDELNAPSFPKEVVSVVNSVGKQVTRRQMSPRQQLKLLKQLGAKPTATGEACSGEEETHLLNTRAVKVEDQELDQEAVTALLQRAEARSTTGVEFSEGTVVKLASNVFEELVEEISRNETQAEDVKDIKESLARLEKIVLSMQAHIQSRLD